MQTSAFRYTIDDLRCLGIADDSSGFPRELWEVGVRATRLTASHQPEPGSSLLLVADREYPSDPTTGWRGPIPPGETRRATFRHLLPPGVEPTRVELREALKHSVGIDL